MQRSRAATDQWWVGVLKIVVAFSAAYLLAGWLGLTLRVEPGIAVFWPAAGIAIGALLVLGPRARWPVVAAVVVGTIACNLIIGRRVWLAIPFGFINAGHTLLTVWLLEHWFGSGFKLEDVRRVMGFLAAVAIGSAIAAVGAAITVNLIDPSTSPLRVWRLWFAACSVGVVTVAPVLIGIRDFAREPIPLHEVIKGWAGIFALAALSALLISIPDGPWATALPETFVFPFLLWFSISSRPVFAAAAAFVVGLIVIGATTLDIGHFDTGRPLAERIVYAQAFVLAAAILAALLAALFAERRRSRHALDQSAERLQLALDGAELGTFSANLMTGRLECDDRAGHTHGHNPRPTTIHESRRYIHPDDLVLIDAAVKGAARTAGPWRVDYRVVPPPGHEHAGEIRSIRLEGLIVRDHKGTPVGLLGITRDITERKRAEHALAERNAQMDLAHRAALVGCYTYDLAGKKMRFSRLNPATYGLPLNTMELTAQQWYARVHRDDMQKQRAEHIRAFKERRPELTNEFRVVRPGGEVRWIEARSLITYDGGGRAQHMMGIYIDVTARKQAEDRQRVLVAELDHRVKNVLATVSAVVDQTSQSSNSITDFTAALHRRIQSMGRTHELLSASSWRGISVAELVQRELAPYAKDGNTEVSGPAVVLRAEMGQVMAMVVHELATNAAKHGALSAHSGRVTVRWQQRSNGHQRHAPLVLHWSEVEGPRVEAPTKAGYGTSVIRDVIPYEFGGTIDLTFAAPGVQCRIELPANWLSHEQDHTTTAPSDNPASCQKHGKRTAGRPAD